MTTIAAELEPAVEALFGPRTELALRYVLHLGTSAVERGLIGPREVPRLWERHVLNCAAVSSLVPADGALVDVGSGAGLPGLVLAIARPDVSVTLLEPLLRRTVWLDEVVADLDLTGQVTVHRGRAEEYALGHPAASPQVTARAVAPLGRLWGWCRPLLAPGGELLALKGASAEQELADSRGALTGVAGSRLECCGEGLLETPTAVVVLTRGDEQVAPGRGRAARATRGHDGGRGPRSSR